MESGDFSDACLDIPRGKGKMISSVDYRADIGPAPTRIGISKAAKNGSWRISEDVAINVLDQPPSYVRKRVA